MAVAALALTPALATATTWCVKDPTCPSGGNSSQSTIQGAVNAASNSDTIAIGPGKFMEVVTNGSGKVLTFRGAGPTQTVIQSPSGGTTLLAGSQSTVENLGVELAVGGNTGLDVHDATNVAITAPAGLTTGTGVVLHGGVFDSGSISLPLGPGTATTGVLSAHTAGGAVQDSTITASTGIQSILHVARDKIRATVGLSLGNGSNGGGLSEDYVIDDALVLTAPGATAETAISLNATSHIDTLETPAVTLTIRHCTLVGSGADGSIGVGVTATATNSGLGVTAQIDSTIIRGYAPAISRLAAGGGGFNAGASIEDDYSDFNPAAELDKNGGTPIGTGAIIDGSHNLNVDPGFVNQTFGDPAGFHLFATSPVIGAGDPVLLPGESPTDADGNPRFTFDHGTAPAVSDMGAFQYQPHSPTVHATGPAKPILRKAATFTATGSDPNPGDQVTFAWKFDDGGTATGAVVTHAFTKPGRHTATVIATNLDGLTATDTVTVTVLGPGAISHLKVNGSKITYDDSEPATTTLTIKRKGHKVTSFKHADTAGRNTDDLKRGKLKPGTYTLTAVPDNAAGKGKAASVSFKVG
jgi:PKD domain